MSKVKLLPGIVHCLPKDVELAIVSSEKATMKWQAITPLARNEWICWVEEAKKDSTRLKRISRAINDLESGKSRPCCWPGCSHREKDGKAKSKEV